MNKHIFTIIGMLMGVLAFSQNCILGNAENTNFAAEVFPANYLLGSKYTLVESKTLNTINLIGNTENAQVQMAVYDDIDGKPGNLLAKTAIKLMNKEVVRLPVDSIMLLPGDYWIMAVYNKKGSHTYINLNAEGNEVYYTKLEFGETIPEDATGFKSFKGQDYTYFLSFDCYEETDEEIKIYPNPASETISILNHTKSCQISIYNHFQKEILKQKITPELNKINIQSLSNGIYFISIDGKAPIIFIKE